MDTLYSICDGFTHLKMSPVFEIVHFTLMALNMKKDLLNTVAFTFEKKHPLASWLATMMLCFAGGVFNCLIFGKPLATLFLKPEKIATASLVWYLVNFMPGLYSILATRLGMTVIIALKEVQRVYGVHGGVQEASEEYPNQYLFYFINGLIRGSAAEIMMYFARLMAGVLRPNTHQFLAPNVVFKASAVLSALFLAEEVGKITVDHKVFFTCVIIALIYLRLCMVWGFVNDPFMPLENLFSAIFFGGMWDALQRVRAEQKSQRPDHENNKIKRH